MFIQVEKNGRNCIVFTLSNDTRVAILKGFWCTNASTRAKDLYLLTHKSSNLQCSFYLYIKPFE